MSDVTELLELMEPWATPRRSKTSSRWSTRNSISWPPITCATSGPGTHCRRPRWCMKPTCVSAACARCGCRIARISMVRAHTSCDACSSIMRGAGTRRNAEAETRRHRLGGHRRRYRSATGSGGARSGAQRLAAFAPEKPRVVELRYFGGLSVDETAEYMSVSKTVKRHWRFARAWLFRTLGDPTVGRE